MKGVSKKRKTTKVGISNRPANLCPPTTLKEIKASPYVYKISRLRIDNQCIKVSFNGRYQGFKGLGEIA
jgi:hypothetical protein